MTRNSFNLSEESNLNEAAKTYISFLELLKRGYKKIYVAKIPNTGVGIAINDET